MDNGLALLLVRLYSKAGLLRNKSKSKGTLLALQEQRTKEISF
jgi:hypothetical protein